MANPTWFNATKYLENKLAQLQATDSKGNWTAESLTKVLEANGYKGDEGAYKHFSDFGMNENVSPNADFDTTFYLNAKAAQLNALNVGGKSWTAVSVMDAIKSSGMNSAWEHYVNFGSQEGIATSSNFDTAQYVIEKTALMNKTSEGGRTNWTVDEVKAALAENNLTALEHYSQFGKAEFKAADFAEKFHTPATPKDTATGFDPYTGVQTYETLTAAIKAKVDGTLAAKYAITTVDNPADITVAQQKVMADVLSGATPASTATPKYSLTDTVAALDADAQIVTHATSYSIADTLLNVAQGNDSLVNNAAKAEAKVAFTAAAKDADGKDTAATVTTVKYDDIDGKVDSTGKGEITLVRADADATTKAEGKAEIDIDASAHASAFGTADKGFDVDSANDAFTSTLTDLSYKFIATAKDDFLTVNGVDIAVVDAGAGNDNINSLESGQEPTHALTLIGNDGSDILRGSSAADTIYAGNIAGKDATTTSVGRYSGTDTFIQDTAYKTALNGKDFVNYINGWKGDDTLYASNQADSFEYHQGKAGIDNNTVESYATLTFKDQGTDTIHNFTIGKDTLFINVNEEKGYTGAAHGTSETPGTIDILMKGDIATTAGENAVTAAVTTLAADVAKGIDGVNDYKVVFTFGTGDNADTLTINLVDVQGVASGATLAAADLLLY